MKLFAKSTVILCASLLIPESAKATLSLSQESKNYIALVTLSATITSGAVGYFLNKFFSSDDQEKSFPWKWVLIPAAIGGAIGGLFSYNNCPEIIINYADNFLQNINEMPLMKDIISDTATDAKLKKEFVTSDFKTVALVERMRAIYSKIVYGLKRDLLQIKDDHFKPYITPLVAKLTRYEEGLKNWIYALNPEYIQELAEKTAMEMQKQIAHAKTMAANAEWHKAVWPNPKTIIITR